jgi:uncharacterized protein
MTSKKHFFAGLFAIVFLLGAISVQAQDAKPTPTPAAGPNISPEKLALVKELLELAHSRETVEAILKAQADQLEKQLPEIIWQAVSGMNEMKLLSRTEREQLHQEVLTSSSIMNRKMYELLQSKIDFGLVVEEISVDLYDKYFTEEELRDLVAFNKSATGRKVIEKMPQLYSESMARASDVLGPKIIEAIRELQDQQTIALTNQIQAKIKAKPTKTPTTTPKRRRH